MINNIYCVVCVWCVCCVCVCVCVCTSCRFFLLRLGLSSNTTPAELTFFFLPEFLQLVLHASERLLHGGVLPGQDLHQAVDELNRSFRNSSSVSSSRMELSTVLHFVSNAFRSFFSSLISLRGCCTAASSLGRIFIKQFLKKSCRPFPAMTSASAKVGEIFSAAGAAFNGPEGVGDEVEDGAELHPGGADGRRVPETSV
ncbi:hypothetical protein F7725_006389 [Dissostichus mawsoni]|uniref:Uncharacterized protein n=1 Tax=Dissostichus mawsoni TaxID=36200 RepID=A0A7J5XVG3_DISMA|nr:hypothetical protein F7725_006389 [Dissostichus mawsoni]